MAPEFLWIRSDLRSSSLTAERQQGEPAARLAGNCVWQSCVVWLAVACGAPPQSEH